MPDVSEWAVTTPDALAIASRAGDRTFAELDANANRLARALRRRDLAPGDAVALISSNRPEFAEVLLACQRAGLRLTPVNWHLTGDEAGYIVSDCEAKAIIASPELVDLCSEARAHAPRCGVALSVGGARDGFESYEGAIAMEQADPIPDPAPGGTMLYTSGTTGRPKGVRRQFGAPRRGSIPYDYDPKGGDRHLLTGPLYHAAPLGFSLSTPLAFGATVVFMECWDAEEALRLVDGHRVSHTHMVPTMFHRLLSLPETVRRSYDTSSLQLVVHGAAPCPITVKRRMIEWLGPIFYEYYAATEGAGSACDSRTWLERPGTVGRPPAGQVRILDEFGNAVPAGEVGVVYLLSPSASRFEYYKDSEKTAETFKGEHFTLGDVGYLDDDGYLFLTDRSANLIISGGVNIYPAEVDAALLEHGAVGDVATIGVPDEEWGEEVLAVVELQAGIGASDDLARELIEHCRGRLAHYKCPRRVEFVDALPRDDNGKVYKRVLRDQRRSITHTPEEASSDGHL